MKKLNITKKQYDESKYFTKKYGAIKFVSESGKHYKTDKGVVLALEGTETQDPNAQGAEGAAQQTDESLKDIGNAIKDTAKELGSKAKAGIKKGAKAVSNFFNGNFRKNDQVEVSGGEDSDGNPVNLKGVVKNSDKNTVTIEFGRQAAESDDGADEADVTRGELTDILKDVVAEVEKVCDSQDISFEEVAGIEKPEGESDEEADKDEVVATKDEVAEVLAGVIDTVEKVADQNDIELPGEDDEDDEDDENGEGNEDDGVTVDEGCDCGKEDCPECNPDGVKKECGGQTCECGDSDKVMESRRARAKIVREAIARRAKARKILESRERRMKVRKVLESIRRKRAAKKVLESIRRKRIAKKMMESRKIRARKAGMSK